MYSKTRPEDFKLTEAPSEPGLRWTAAEAMQERMIARASARSKLPSAVLETQIVTNLHHTQADI